MSWRDRVCRALFCAMLAIGAAGGTPMRPEEIEDLMHNMNRPTIVNVLPEGEDRGDDFTPKASFFDPTL